MGKEDGDDEIIVATILMRGSSLCKKDVPGKYWPSVISVSMALASFQAVENSLCPFFDGPDPVVDGKAPSLEVLEHSRDGRHGYAGIVQGALLGRKDIQRFAVEDDMAWDKTSRRLARREISSILWETKMTVMPFS